jgi:threonine dehydrogenase-like Zn-dependent dehydrogenase
MCDSEGRGPTRETGMRAVRSTPPGVTVVDVDVPGDGELIAIRSAAICGSDLKYVAWGFTRILGHELAGTTRDGTPVAIEPMFGCDGCDYCNAGQWWCSACTRPTSCGRSTSAS